MAIHITTASIEAAAAFLSGIPEFKDAYPLGEYQKRLEQNEHLILLAYTEDGVACGCKVGYRLSSSSFYSWMGGVMPQWRRHGVAELLAVAQESWAQEQGYERIRFKTRNSCRAMLHFALNRGFHIVGVEPRDQLPDYRIWLEKEL